MFQTLDAFMNSLNADILGLNNTLKTDSLQLVKGNPLVQSIMAKIDIITSFIRMTYRVLEKLSNRGILTSTYYEFVKSPKLASILVRVFGVLIQIPNSPNNNSIINITGLQTLDNLVNQMKTKSIECINFLLKKKDKMIASFIQNN